jgi:hypothetical protein
MGENKQRCMATCQCGQTAVEVIGAPIISAVCYCDTCQAAGHEFEGADGAPRTVGADGGTEYCLYRKDRVKIIRGGQYLLEHRLTPESKTRRVVATCCNTPMFLDVTQGHWLSVYRSRLPVGVQPPQMRVMTGDRPAHVTLGNDIPNYPGFAPAFLARLLLAWAAISFRRPKVTW